MSRFRRPSTVQSVKCLSLDNHPSIARPKLLTEILKRCNLNENWNNDKCRCEFKRPVRQHVYGIIPDFILFYSEIIRNFIPILRISTFYAL